MIYEQTDPDKLEEPGRTHFLEALGSARVRLATTGYSSPPPGYGEAARSFLMRLCKLFEPQNLALLTSPTTSSGSIDLVTTEVAHTLGLGIGYLTAQQYLPYVNVSELPSHVDPGWFSEQPKLSFPSPSAYSTATAVHSNRLLLTGGRETALSDFANALHEGNRVLALTGLCPSVRPWDGASVTNAAEYIAGLHAGELGNEMPNRGARPESPLSVPSLVEQYRTSIAVVDTKHPDSVDWAHEFLI